MKGFAFVAIASVSISLCVSASCMTDGKRTQSVVLSVEGKALEVWQPAPGETRNVRLPGGFVVGVQIDPTSPEHYRALLTKARAFDELVKISIYDANGEIPKLLSTTWGGANSKQGFGPRGGANGIPQLGDQIELWLHYPVCVTAETIGDLK